MHQNLLGSDKKKRERRIVREREKKRILPIWKAPDTCK